MLGTPRFTPPLIVVVVPDCFFLSGLSLFRDERELLREMVDEGDRRPRDELELFDNDEDDRVWLGGANVADAGVGIGEIIGVGSDMLC